MTKAKHDARHKESLAVISVSVETYKRNGKATSSFKSNNSRKESKGIKSNGVHIYRLCCHTYHLIGIGPCF